MNNRLYNCKNPYQGEYKKVLCVCSVGLLRSPTVALVLSMPPFNYNTRSAGIDVDYALIPVDEVLLNWADEIVCMEADHKTKILGWLDLKGIDKPIICLYINDKFDYREPLLMSLIKDMYIEETAIV